MNTLSDILENQELFKKEIILRLKGILKERTYTVHWKIVYKKNSTADYHYMLCNDQATTDLQITRLHQEGHLILLVFEPNNDIHQFNITTI